MLDTTFTNLNNYLETTLERTSIRKLLVTLLLVFVGLAVTVFAVSTYKSTYNAIYEERVAKLEYVDDFVIEILEYQNSLVKNHQKTLKQAQEESIAMVKGVHFENDDYIWIDRLDGSSVYHPVPKSVKNATVTSQIKKVINESGKGYFKYKWIKLDANKKKEYTKVSFVESYKPWGWIVGTGVYVDDISYKVINSMLDGVLPVLLIFVFMIVLLRFIILNCLIKPIDKLADLSMRLANNDLNVTLPTSKSNTELGKLYKIFNKFVELFEKERKTAQREILIRSITEKTRSSLDVDKTLSFICEETAKLFNVQRSAISTFTPPGAEEGYVVKKEYKATPDLQSFYYGTRFSETAGYWKNNLLKTGQVLAIDNIEEADVPEYFKQTYRMMGIKSIIGASIKKDNEVWGTLVLSEYANYRHWSEEEKSLLETIGNQVHIAINQAELFEKEREAAETEKFNRKILEILRTTLDKESIKHQFVKNIGQYFKADRVFFSDYDAEKKVYLKIDKNSEYLSSSKEKSFVDFDFSDESIRGFIQPLLEKRELKIMSWDEYIQEKPKTDALISRFENANVKSSYNLPVLYEEKIMGYFCIEFTQTVTKLSDDDINRIRNMCTQAGIALYHAELFAQTRKSANLKGVLIADIVVGAREILKNIVDISEEMTKTEEKCDEHIRHINHINEAANQLLQFTENIVKSSKIDPD